MFPPCDPSILENNPQFKRLYANLKTSVLNPDASTRPQSTSSAHTVGEDLKQCQNQDAKKRITEQMLNQLAFAPDASLPADHHDNLAIITLFLSTPPGTLTREENDSLSLLAEDIQTFLTNIPSLIQPLSTLLAKSIHDLRALSAQETTPDTEPPSHHARTRARDRRVRSSLAVPLLSHELSTRLRNLRNTQLVDIPAAHRKMAVIAAEVAALRTGVLERTVLILERAKHGALARATKAKADHLAIVAQGVEGKLEVTRLEIASLIHSPDAVAVLARYQQHLMEISERLEEDKKIAIGALKGLGDSEASGTDGGPLDDIKTRYGALVTQVESIKAEIARLKN